MIHQIIVEGGGGQMITQQDKNTRGLFPAHLEIQIYNVLGDVTTSIRFISIAHSG